MKEFLCESTFFGVAVSLGAYEVGVLIRKKWNFSLFNPLLISIVIVALVLSLIRIDYDTYYAGAKYLSYFLTPATVCLAIPLYEQLSALKNNWKAILAGILSGVLTSLLCILAFAAIFKFDHESYVSLLPKSITTAIGIGISQELGGIVPITAASICITGILGNVIAELVCKLFRIHEPVAKGVAIGTSSHAMGTVKAIEMGEVEGAMSGLSIAVAGLLTVVCASVFANFL